MTTDETLGVINYTHIERKTDYLFRVSIKALIKRDDGKVLAVKEAGRDWWDMPGGGMDHDEDIKTALARELHEEVNLTGDFTYRVIAVEDPKQLDHAAIWQLRLIFEVVPANMTFAPGEDGDEVEFIDPKSVKDEKTYARKIYEYSQLV